MQSCATRGVVAVYEEDVCAFDAVQGERFVNESDAHLSLEEDGRSCAKHGGDTLDPFQSCGSLPGSARLMAVAEGAHGLSGRNADRVEEEHFAVCRAHLLNGLREWCLAAAGGAGEDNERGCHGWSVPGHQPRGNRYSRKKRRGAGRLP